jgi:hypothetical protein
MTLFTVLCLCLLCPFGTAAEFVGLVKQQEFSSNQTGTLQGGCALAAGWTFSRWR